MTTYIVFFLELLLYHFYYLKKLIAANIITITYTTPSLNHVLILFYKSFFLSLTKFIENTATFSTKKNIVYIYIQRYYLL